MSQIPLADCQGCPRRSGPQQGEQLRSYTLCFGKLDSKPQGINLLSLELWELVLD
jgi:hypothetical protein